MAQRHAGNVDIRVALIYCRGGASPSRVIHKMGLKEDPQNFLLMHTVGVNVSGQIASVIAGGLIMSLVYTIG